MPDLDTSDWYSKFMHTPKQVCSWLALPCLVDNASRLLEGIWIYISLFQVSCPLPDVLHARAHEVVRLILAILESRPCYPRFIANCQLASFHTSGVHVCYVSDLWLQSLGAGHHAREDKAQSLLHITISHLNIICCCNWLPSTTLYRRPARVGQGSASSNFAGYCSSGSRKLDLSGYVQLVAK